MSRLLEKVLVIVGPTSSGKTSLSIELARKFTGEVISADSRQVYKGMDLGTGKVTKKEMQGIKHYLLDVVSPISQFNAGKFVRMGEKAIKEIIKKRKLPIICGGTGFWIDALLYGLPKTVTADWKLRKKLDKLSAAELFNKLKKLWPERAKVIDPNNKRRLIRALELALNGKKTIMPHIRAAKYDILKIGVLRDKAELNKRIHDRLISRFKQGMIQEVANLHKKGVSWKRLDDFGLEYRFISRYLTGAIKDQKEMIQLLEIASNQYAKRQNTWFKRDKEIIWVNNPAKANSLVKKWLKI
ncbi:MAG: tRNA (adenosine(37)-N6)-dimethylallyltransferase MiaA [Candidatus Parcubacteria bacterium]|nr:tRNA (adenosine(37)-N6)-dimethylallyltransferase MiaA [Candidatus Parcubacteria bacterium]